ncbi:MAG: glutaredoxin family protein [Spirochaetes bacterium]|nr:MAG: glutaredoxin family protein [Spirochaetota bacterium]
MANFTRVEGKDKGRIELYAISTCVWCKKARNLLDERGVEYFYIYVDLLESEENSKIKEDIKKWNPLCSFPTLIFDGERCVVGFDEGKILKELG